MHILYLASVLYTYTLWTILTFERPTNRLPPPWPFHTFQGFFLTPIISLLISSFWSCMEHILKSLKTTRFRMNFFTSYISWPSIILRPIITILLQNHAFCVVEHFFKVLSLSFHDRHWFSGRLSMFSLTSSHLMLHLSQFRWKWKPADMIIWIFGICGWGCYLLVYLL